MPDTAPRDDAILEPRYWKAWLAVAAVGLVVTFGAGAVFGIGPIDVLLLKHMALAPFTIFDYVLFGMGAVQAMRHVSATSVPRE